MNGRAGIRSGKVRLTIDWTSEGHQHLLITPIVVDRRAVPIFWQLAMHISIGSKQEKNVGIGIPNTKLVRLRLTLSMAPALLLGVVFTAQAQSARTILARS